MSAVTLSPIIEPMCARSARKRVRGRLRASGAVVGLGARGGPDRGVTHGPAAAPARSGAVHHHREIHQVLRDRDVGQLVLGAGHPARAAPTPLGHQDPPLEEQLAAPHAPRLAPFERALEARRDHWAASADPLGPSDLPWLRAKEHRADPGAAPAAAGVHPPGLPQVDQACAGPLALGFTMSMGL
jgi:hypothetical protein